MPPVAEGDVCLHIAPISHASGYQFVPVWLMGGVNLLVEKFEAAAIADLMEKERVGYVFMAPTMVQDMLQVKNLAGRDWSALKVLLIGAAPITEATVRRAHAVWGPALCQLYGQTEGVPATMTMASEWVREVPGSQPLRSLGKVHPFCELEIRDPDSHAPLGFGEVGEICYKSDGQMTGYWNDEEATAEHLRDGWVMTGDVGTLDQNGYVYLLDRKDDMILSGGFNIWPTELENVLASHPAIVEVVVFGVPHERFGEVPHAVCRIAEGATVGEAELIELCARELGSYKKPARVDLRTEPLPRTPVGKVSRKQLRAPFWAGTGRTK